MDEFSVGLHKLGYWHGCNPVAVHSGYQDA